MVHRGRNSHLKVCAIIFNYLSEEYHRVERIRCSYCSFCYLAEFATTLAFQVRKYFKWKNGKRSDRYGPSSDTTALQCLRIGGTPGCKVQRATGILSYPGEHLRLLIGRP